jgi:hypothetical protein
MREKRRDESRRDRLRVRSTKRPLRRVLEGRRKLWGKLPGLPLPTSRNPTASGVLAPHAVHKVDRLSMGGGNGGGHAIFVCRVNGRNRGGRVDSFPEYRMLPQALRANIFSMHRPHSFGVGHAAPEISNSFGHNPLLLQPTNSPLQYKRRLIRYTVSSNRIAKGRLDTGLSETYNLIE